MRIEVADNGVESPQRNLTRIFNHGFTNTPGWHGLPSQRCSDAKRTRWLAHVPVTAPVKAPAHIEFPALHAKPAWKRVEG